MEATRSRLGSLLEWLIAATVMVVVLAAGSIVVREVRNVRAITPVIAEEGSALEPPAGIPPRSVSVPMLVLADGKELRVGARGSDVTALIGHAAQVGADAVDRVAGRERLTRFYTYVGSRFALVFEPAEGEAGLRVAAIYRE